MKRTLAVLVVAAVGASAGWALGTDEYRAEAAVEIVPATPEILYATPGTTTSEQREDDAYLRMVDMLLRSKRVTESVQTHELLRPFDGVVGADSEQFASRMSVRRDSARYLVHFGFTDERLPVAVAGAAAYADVAVAFLLERGESRQAVDAVREQQERTAAELERLSAEITEATDGMGFDALHVEYRSALAALERARGRLDEAMLDVADRATSDDTNATVRRDELLELITAKEENLRRLSAAYEAAEKLSLEREALTERDRALRDRVEQLEAETSGQPQVRLIDDPVRPTAPFSSNRLELAALGAVLGLVFAFGAQAGMRRTG